MVVNLYVFLWRDQTSIPEIREAAMAGREVAATSALDGKAGGGGGGPEALPEQDEPEEERWVDGEVTRGDSLGKILSREGLEVGEADELLRAIQPHMDFRKIRPGQSYRILFDDFHRLQAFEFHVSPVREVTAERMENGELVGKGVDAETDVRVHGVGGAIDSSLYMTIKDIGEDPRLVSYLVDIFAYDLDFYTDQHKGDTFRLLIEKEYLDGKFLHYRRVLAAEYRGKAGTFRAFRWRYPDGTREEYFDEQGRAIAKTFLKTPLKFHHVSSRFDRKRMHPILHRQRAHLGVDYAARIGTPVWAAAAGKIVYRGWRGGGGNTLILKHSNGYQTVYMHLSKFRRGQKVGQRVKQKTVVGYVGSTGLSTGAHLHFGVKKNGKYINPLKIKMERGPSVAKKFRSEFEKDLASMVERLDAIRVGPQDSESSGSTGDSTAEQPAENP